MLDSAIAARRASALPQGLACGARGAGLPEIRPLPPAARFALRLRAADAEGAGRAAGLPLDGPINRLAAAGERAILRLGPDEWLVLGPGGEAEALGGALAASLAGRVVHSLVDIGHRDVAVSVSGPGAPLVVNAGCPLDLGAAAFPTGAATRTLLGKAEVVLARVDDAPSYRIECRRSYAPYLASFLRRAADDLDAPPSRERAR